MTRLNESDIKKVIYEVKEDYASSNEKRGSQSKARVPVFDPSQLNISLILYSGFDGYNIFGERRKRVFRKQATYISR